MQKVREKFGTEELAICLSHYDLGVINKIEEFPRGSSRSPKVVLDSQKGKFLFKRRARGKNNLDKVAFTHRIQLWLAAQNFPLPHLLGTREKNNSMLVLNSDIYEMFEYIPGTGYDGSLQATYHSGHVLGLYHKLLRNFQSEYIPPGGSYHSASAILRAVSEVPSSLKTGERPSTKQVRETVEEIQDAYRTCVEKSNQTGLADWNRQIVHGDWHPGNMLFRKGHVVAVIDYDSARLYQRVIDLANGALQFSIVGGSRDPSKWPDYIDESRFRRFIAGYDSVEVISTAELEAIPYLMCEAMIAEAVLPIAATGSFGRLEGFPFLEMIRRKVRWILEHTDEMKNLVEK